MTSRALLMSIALLFSACGTAASQTQSDTAQASTVASSSTSSSSEPDDASAVDDVEQTSASTTSTSSTTAPSTTNAPVEDAFDDLATRVAEHLRAPNDYPYFLEGPTDERPACAALSEEDPALVIRSGFPRTVECLPETFWGADGFDPPEVSEVTQLWYELHVEDRSVTTRAFVGELLELREFDDSRFNLNGGSLDVACALQIPDQADVQPELPCSAIWRYEIERGDVVLLLAIQGLDQTGETQATALGTHLGEIFETLDQLAVD